jgi:hypothetical protein
MFIHHITRRLLTITRNTRDTSTHHLISPLQLYRTHVVYSIDIEDDFILILAH